MTESKPHPAKFSKSILDKLWHLTIDLPEGARVLDPFAGVGLVHALSRFDTVGVEIEPEWACAHDQTICGDSRLLDTMFDPESFDALITSPSYGSRMADAYAGDPKGSRRVTYRIYLERPLSEGSSAGMHWTGKTGVEYRQLHQDVWGQCYKLLKPHGKIFVNVSNHIRGGVEQDVVGWHQSALMEAGFKILEVQKVETPRMRMGANHEKRVPFENIIEGVK